MYVCVWGGGRIGAGSTLTVPNRVSQKGRKVFTANSLHSSVSERSAHIRHLHGRKHNLFDATLPTRPEPSSPHWRFTVFNFHFIFRTGRQANAGEWTPSCCKSPFKHPAKCNLGRVNKRPPHYTPQDICFYLFWNVQLIFVVPPNDVCKRWTEKSHTSFFLRLVLPLLPVF